MNKALLFCVHFLLAAAVVAPFQRTAFAAGNSPGQDSGGIYGNATSQYLAGKWDELSVELTSDARAFAALAPAQRADVDYMRRALAESRPAWWKPVKAGQRMRFRPLVWGHTLSATFDPDGKNSSRIDFANGEASVTVGWNAAEMDNPAVDGELEFTKGEHADVDLWTALGIAESSAAISPYYRIGLKPDAQTRLSRFLEFRGNVTGAYYATPRARRWAVWLGISGWSHEYDKMPSVMPRKAMGIFFAAEILGHPETYPSVKWPEDPPADGAESKMIWTFSEWISSHNFTFAEDKAFREALKAFAQANSTEAKLRRNEGRILLPNGLAFSLDNAADKPLAIRRDAWAKAQIERGKR